MGRGRGFHAWQKDVPYLDCRIWLAMPSEPPVIFSAAKMLDIQFGSGMIHNLSKDASAFNDGLAYAGILAALIQQDSVKLQSSALFSGAIIHLDHITFADSILSRSIFENCVHRWLPLPQGIRIRKSI